MTPQTLIALNSPAPASGKSTVAKHLVEAHGFKHVAFATPLKRMTEVFLESLGMDHDEIEARVHGHRKHEMIPVADITSRRFQQLLGTEFGRDQIKQNLWVDIAMERVRYWQGRGYRVVIDDMRFTNEFWAVQQVGGECWRIQRPGVSVGSAAHASEGALDSVTMTDVWNGATIAELHTAVDDLLPRL